MLVVEGFKVTDIPSITMRSAQITGILAPLIAVSVVMQQILSLLGAQQLIGDFVTSHGRLLRGSVHGDGDRVHLGMILESLPVTIILAPILAPIAHGIGVDPDPLCGDLPGGRFDRLHHAALWSQSLRGQWCDGVPYFRLLKYVMLYILALITVWFIIALVPELSTALLPDRG
jgi:C4-dicarboxylate transporter DctM subunit